MSCCFNNSVQVDTCRYFTLSELTSCTHSKMYINKRTSLSWSLPAKNILHIDRTNCKIVKLFHSRFIKDVPLRLPRVGTAVSSPGCVLCKSGKTDPKEANKNITTNTIEHRTPQSLFPLLKKVEHKRRNTYEQVEADPGLIIQPAEHSFPFPFSRRGDA